MFLTEDLYYIIMFSHYYDLFHIQMSYGRLMDQWNVCLYVCIPL